MQLCDRCNSPTENKSTLLVWIKENDKSLLIGQTNKSFCLCNKCLEDIYNFIYNYKGVI